MTNNEKWDRWAPMNKWKICCGKAGKIRQKEGGGVAHQYKHSQIYGGYLAFVGVAAVILLLAYTFFVWVETNDVDPNTQTLKKIRHDDAASGESGPPVAPPVGLSFAEQEVLRNWARDTLGVVVSRPLLEDTGPDTSSASSIISDASSSGSGSSVYSALPTIPETAQASSGSTLAVGGSTVASSGSHTVSAGNGITVTISSVSPQNA